MSRETTSRGIYQYCLDPGCEFTTVWEGGFAGDDPAIPHLFINPDHTVRGGVNDEHKRFYQMQNSGEMDVTCKVVE